MPAHEMISHTIRGWERRPVAVRPTLTAVEIIEVAPRDGLQNEKQLLGTEAKLELIERAYGQVHGGSR